MTRINIINLLSYSIRAAKFGEGKLEEEKEQEILQHIPEEKHKEYKKLVNYCKRSAYNGNENWLYRIEQFFNNNYQHGDGIQFAS